MTPLQALKKCVELLEGPSNTARAIGESPAYVSSQMRVAKQAAPHCCIRLERAVEGRVTRYQLRPDVFGPQPTIEDLERQLAAMRRQRDMDRRQRARPIAA